MSRIVVSEPLYCKLRTSTSHTRKTHFLFGLSPLPDSLPLQARATCLMFIRRFASPPVSTHRLSVSSHEITIRTRTHTRSLALCTHHSCRQHNKPTPKTLSAAYPGQRAAAKHHPHTSQATHAALVTHLVTHHSTHLNTRTKTPLAVCHEPPASNTPLHKNKPSAFNPDKQKPPASPCAASPLYGLILFKKSVPPLFAP